jgi:hypothetical protein
MASSEQLESFIKSSFRSVWSLEVLLLLKAVPRSWPRHELVAALRASDLVVSQSLESLTAAGLVTVEDSGAAHYSPASHGLGELVDQSRDLYARSPDAVRRLIVIGTSSGGIAAFADAFRLRKD